MRPLLVQSPVTGGPCARIHVDRGAAADGDRGRDPRIGRLRITGRPMAGAISGLTRPTGTPSFHIFVPSCDRALQLDGTLRSMQRHCIDLGLACISVIFKATSREHREAYGVLSREHPQVRFVMEDHFAKASRRLLGAASGSRPRRFPRRRLTAGEVQTFVVDDTLFVRSFSLALVSTALARYPSALGFSLRLGETIRFCQPLGRLSTPPTLVHLDGSGDDEIVAAKWVGREPDWGYPLEISSSVYRRAQLANLLRRISFDSPSTLEDALWQYRKAVEEPHPNLLCFRKPRAFSLPLNRVQQIAGNPISGHERHSVERLANLYLQGWRIDVAAYEGFVPHACHEETELLLRPLE